jgi:hypothetical protein
MIEIPSQLQNENFRFILLKPKSKIPFEKNWQTTANYKFNDPKLLQHILNGGNYGVLGGYGNLLIIDCDSQIIEKMVEDNFPQTFKSHKHYYFICKNARSLKLLKGRETFADIQYKGKQAVGPGSTHPEGHKYKVKKDLAIVENDFKDVEKVFTEFIEKPVVSGSVIDTNGKIQGKRKPTPITEAIIKLLKVSDVMRHFSFDTTKKYTECLLHNSKGKHGFCWDDDKGVWYCQGCHRGGNVVTLIRYCERLI